MKKLAAAIVLTAAGLVIFSLTLFHLIPAHLYETWINRTIESRTGLSLKADSFATAFPFAFDMAGLRVSDRQGKEVVTMDRLRAGLNPLGLLSGLRVDLEGTAGGGEVKGRALAGLFGSSVELEASGVGFGAIGALKTAGIRVDGAFDATLSVKMVKGCPKGSLRAHGVNLGGAEVSFRGLPLPIGGVDEAGMAAEFSDCRVRLDGLWLESDDLSARIKGVVTLSTPFEASPVDMTLELVPGERLLGKEYLLSFVSAYRKSANYFSIPVKGTVGSLSAGI